MWHDFATHKGKKGCSGGVMDGYFGTSAIWTPCNRADFEAYYMRNKDRWCMEPKEDTCCDKEDPNTAGKSFSPSYFFLFLFPFLLE